MVVHADALSDRLGAVHLAARGPAVAMDEPEVRDASWTRARDRARGASRGADGDADDADEASSMTASESDWSDAELREADCRGDSEKPPSAAQGSGRPWAHVSRARAARRRELRAAAAMAAAPPPPRELTESGAGVFLADLDASAAIHVLSHLSPVERARVAAVRRSERAALKSPDIVVEDDPALVTGSADYYDGVVYGSSPPVHSSSRPALRREPRWSSGRLSMGTATHVEGGGHLADAAWREIDLRAAATPAALCTLRGVACGAVRVVDVTGSRLAKRGDILDLARESPQLRELRCGSLGDNGKWSVRDIDAVFEACPSLTLFECDVGVKIDSRTGDEERYEESLGDVRYVLGDRRMRVRRVKIHSGCVDSAHVVFECAARAARAGRLRSVDASWSLKLGCGAARGCAAMMEKHGGGFPLQRLAMRKANIKDPGAMSLAGAIRRAAEAVAAKEKELRRMEWSGRYAGAAGDAAEYESPYGDGRDPVCELRWLDLGSNHINDPGAAALGDALGPNVPITRLNLRDNQVGVLGCRSIGYGVARCGATLRRLDLAHSGFGCQGAVALATALATARSPCALKVLQLGFNSIGADGAKALAAALTSGNFRRLEHLDLACNVLGPDGVAALATLLEPIDSDDSDESGDAASADDGGSTLSDDGKRGAGLYSLDLAVNNAGGDGERGGIRALMKALETNTSLRMLNLRGNDLTPEHAGDVAEMLCENVTLTQLNVGYNKIYNEGAWELAEALSENPSLLGLDIQRNEISDDGAEWIRGLLAANSTIEEVDMRSNQLSPEVVESFGKSFGERVNARWQQEPPKVEKNDENMAAQRTMVGEGGGRVAAKKAERAARKAARKAARGR